MGEVVEIREEEDVIQIISDSEEQSPSKGGGNVGDDLIIISCQVRPRQAPRRDV